MFGKREKMKTDKLRPEKRRGRPRKVAGEDSWGGSGDDEKGEEMLFLR
jgi:hypothetical protein